MPLKGRKNISMKILILVLSFNEPPYDELMKAQKETFDSVSVPGVKSVYYRGGGDSFTGVQNPMWNELIFPCTDNYFFMSEKFKLCLEAVQAESYDFIFRTNSSSYVNKSNLIKFSEKLPTERCYAGWKIDGPEYSICSGAGFFISKDVAKILREKIDVKKEIEEDCYIGKILWDEGIEIIDDKSRYDVPSEFLEIPTDRYHYRLKTGDRRKDADNMRKIHQLILNK